jgi:hypothetical protein
MVLAMLSERSVWKFSHVVDGQMSRVGIEAEEADVEIIVVVEKSHLGSFGRAFP